MRLATVHGGQTAFTYEQWTISREFCSQWCKRSFDLLTYRFDNRNWQRHPARWFAENVDNALLHRIEFACCHEVNTYNTEWVF